MARNDSISLIVAEVPALYRQWVTEQREFGNELGAKALERAATVLEAALQRQDDDLLTLEQAAAESGYSADHLGRQLRLGKLPNAGRPNAPRLRRRDIPRKVGALPRRAGIAQVGASHEQIARAVVTHRKGA
jgi:hypothetical protein